MPVSDMDMDRLVVLAISEKDDVAPDGEELRHTRARPPKQIP